MSFVSQSLGLGNGQLALIDPIRNGIERDKQWG
jgi:hypothetical protein